MYKLHTCTPGRLSDSVFIIFMFFKSDCERKNDSKCFHGSCRASCGFLFYFEGLPSCLALHFLPVFWSPRHFSASTSVLVVVCRRVCFTGSCSSVFECLLVYVFYFFFLAFSLSSLLLWTSPLVCTFLLAATLFCAFCVSTWFVDAHLFFVKSSVFSPSPAYLLPVFVSAFGSDLWTTSKLNPNKCATLMQHTILKVTIN